MACKLICDACGAEINPKNSRTFMTLSQNGEEKTYDLCVSCKFHLQRWIDGEEKFVDVLEGV